MTAPSRPLPWIAPDALLRSWEGVPPGDLLALLQAVGWMDKYGWPTERAEDDGVARVSEGGGAEWSPDAAPLASLRERYMAERAACRRGRQPVPLLSEPHMEHWTTVVRLLRGELGEVVVDRTRCCCSSPGATRRQCADSRGNKSPCACACHRKKATWRWDYKRLETADANP
ncbi:hypothetical protein [Alienimonas sp. DA493]|uniref:hypothetical protein n=1 Tax=Alienimonas sp. DA493 TaxID=3373605 RepID=UPI003754B34C